MTTTLITINLIAVLIWCGLMVNWTHTPTNSTVTQVTGTLG